MPNNEVSQPVAAVIPFLGYHVSQVFLPTALKHTVSQPKCCCGQWVVKPVLASVHCPVRSCIGLPALSPVRPSGRVRFSPLPWRGLASQGCVCLLGAVLRRWLALAVPQLVTRQRVLRGVSAVTCCLRG